VTTTSPDFPHIHLDILTEREAAMLQLHYADGWTKSRISRAFEVDESTVRYHIKQALCVLCKGGGYCLGPDGSRTNEPTSIGASFEQATDEGAE
jgi:hypothetical protein